MGHKKILLTGGGSPTARFAAKVLTDRGLAVRTLVREENHRVDELRAMGAEVVFGDLLKFEDVRMAVEGIGSAYFLYPVRENLIEATAFFAQAAREAGVEAVVNMSQISARREAVSHAAQNHWIAERVFDWSGLSMTHLRPTFFAQWLIYPPFIKTIKEEGKIKLPFGKGRHAPIAAEDQGRLIAAILQDPAPHRGKTYTLHGPVEMDQAAIAAEVGKVLGRKISYESIGLDEYHELLEPYELFTPFVVQHVSSVAVDYQNGIFAGTNDVIERVTGTPPMTVGQFVELHRSEFES